MWLKFTACLQACYSISEEFYIFIPRDSHSSDNLWMLDLGWWMVDLKEFRNNNIFKTLCTTMYFMPGNDKYHSTFDLWDEILTPDHPNVNTNVWRRAGRNNKFKIIYFSSLRIFILGTQPPLPPPHSQPHSHPTPRFSCGSRTFRIWAQTEWSRVCVMKY